MREHSIRVPSIEFIDFLEVTIGKAVNRHTTAKVAGTISDANGDGYVEKHRPGEGVTILAVDQSGQEQIMLNGVIDTISIRDMNGLKVLTFTAVSRSFLMDLEEHTRTFQDGALTYGDVTDSIQADGCRGNILLPQHKGVAIGSMLIQYQETDWEFCNRLASRLNTCVVADNLLDIPYLSIGMPQKSGQFEVDATEYTMRRDHAEFLDCTHNGVSGYTSRDSVCYEVTSRELQELCTGTTFQGRRVYVYSVSTKLTGATLLHTYTLREAGGFRRKETFNRRMIGASLKGTVKEIDRDQVRVEISDDVAQKNHQWFDYATVYASPDNTGWYFMPEVGDAVRLHLPNEHEENAYVISAVHVGGRDDADTKSIRTKWAKAVVFSPESILITNGTGSSILLDDNQGIVMNSNKKVKIAADDSISMTAEGQIAMMGNRGVALQQADSVIVVKENIDLSADHVRIR